MEFLLFSLILLISIFYIYYKKVNYNHLLEFPKNYNFNKNFLNKLKYVNNNLLIDCIHNFCIKNNVYKNGAIISLSGGVDSMVVLAILLHLQQKYNFPIFTASIDYGLRKESHDESNFLIEYTKMFNIKYYISYIKDISRKKEDSVKRSEFEEASRNLRFDTYKKIIQENNLNNVGIFVAHHQDDIIENIFTNSMKGGNILDIEVMKEINKINDVTIFRPLLQFKKKLIFDFAHTYGIPYFLDTTPKWSKRGKMRNEIFPLLNNVFGPDWKNKLKLLGTQSNEWGEYFNKYILLPWFNEVTFLDYGIIIPIKDQPSLIYSNVILKSLHHIGEPMIKRTSVEKIMEIINNKKIKKLTTLDKHRYAILINNNQLLIFNENKKIFNDIKLIINI